MPHHFIRMLCPLLCLAVGSAAAVETPPSFSKKPTAVRQGDKYKIEFAVDRPTDVSVFIENGSGKVIRHLISGVLGKNPPSPLKPGLAQSVEWDGKADWGKPAPAGPYKARVALGLGARYDKLVASDPMGIQGVYGAPHQSMAIGPDGTLYLVTGAGAPVVNWNGQRLIAVNRDGTFQRTLIPLPANATKAQIEALGGVPMKIGERTVPMITNLTSRSSTGFWSSGSVAMTPGGQFLVLAPNVSIGILDVSGSASPPPFSSAPVMSGFPDATFASCDPTRRAEIASSSDGKYAYLQGMASKYGFQSAPVEPWYAVYRVKLPERTPAEPFFGDPAQSGNDQSHLGKRIGGMAADGKGHLFICDPMNSRVVVVAEANGKFVSSIPAEKPELVAANGLTGEVYLLKGSSGSFQVVKFSSWKDPREQAAMTLTGEVNPSIQKWSLAVDTSAKPVVIWAFDGQALLRIEDAGASFSAKKIGSGGGPGSGGFADFNVDHWRDEPEVYWRVGISGWCRYSEKTEQIDNIPNNNSYGQAGGWTLQPGPDGNLYTLAWPEYLHKTDRDGKLLTWDIPFKTPDGISPYRDPKDVLNAIYVPVCMSFMTHTHGIRADGHHFVFERAPAAPARAFKALREYDASGKRVGDPIIWEASDSVSAPHFDQQGNIYIADVVRPPDHLVPPEFAGVSGTLNEKSSFGFEAKGIAAWYGSIIKFTPRGGMIKYGRDHYAQGKYPAAYEGEPKLDPSFKTVDAGCYAAGSGAFTYLPAKVTGAEWIHPGVSQIFLGQCNCENMRFDVDPFGRVWYPDLGRYRVDVLDTNGNEIMTFGSYGNSESMGPESPVVDPKTGKVRPRSAGDAKDLKSPFSEPEIAFAYPLGVGVSEKYAYVGDSLNRRLLRAKLVYAAEETCAIK